MLTVLTILVVPVQFDRYLVEHTATHYRSSFESIAFHDVTGDGIGELFDCGGITRDIRRSSCRCRQLDDKGLSGTIDQLNVPNLFYGERQIAFSDFNHDNVPEIWMPSGENGEIWLYGFEGTDLNNHKYRFHLDSAGTFKGKYDLGYSLEHSLDVNGDGYDELYFKISNTFPIYPRRVYRVDIRTEEILKSPRASAGFSVEDKAIDSEGSYIFTGRCTTPGNHNESINLPYPDTSGFIYALNEDLEFLFDPIPLSTYPDVVANFVIGKRIYSFLKRRSDYGKPGLVQVHNLEGDLLRNVGLKDGISHVIKQEDNFIVFQRDRIVVLDTSLQVVENNSIRFDYRGINEVDLNGDEKREYLLLDSKKNEYLVLDQNLDQTTTFQNPVNANSRFYLRNIGDEKASFALFGDNKIFTYRYSQNPFYWSKVPVYLGAFLTYWFISHYLFRYYRKNVEKRFEEERKFNRLQILSLKNQMDPHFALNALNSIDWMYKQEEYEKASRFMETYSRLVHQTVNNSDRIGISVYEELSFCRKFCELERMRDPVFSYTIEVSEEVDPFEIEVPRQLLFTHVENAVKHGLRPKDGEKKLEVNIVRVEKDLVIEISNDGIPYREKSESSGTGKGLEIHQQLIAIYRSLKGVKIDWSVGPCANWNGTCVEVMIRNVFPD